MFSEHGNEWADDHGNGIKPCTVVEPSSMEESKSPCEIPPAAGITSLLSQAEGSTRFRAYSNTYRNTYSMKQLLVS